MRFFDAINSADACRICNTTSPGRVILVSIPGTKEGVKIESQQIHERCAVLVAKTLFDAYESEKKHE